MSPKAGGWETWQWDETLFEGAAAFYTRGRLPYAPGLAEVVREVLRLDGAGRLLDVGCGPGTVALRLSHLFSAVVGLDPDSGMLTEAARIAGALGISNATWVKKRAEELPAGLGMFRLVTFAASFHWMDRPRVASVVNPMLVHGGAVMQVDAPAYRPLEDHGLSSSMPDPAPPMERIEELRRRYLVPDRRAGRSIRNTSPGGEDAVFQAAWFAPAETITVPDRRIWPRTADDIVANVFSSSSTVPGLFGDRLARFELDLRRLLAEESPSGRFSVILPDNILRIWRPASS